MTAIKTNPTISNSDYFFVGHHKGECMNCKCETYLDLLDILDKPYRWVCKDCYRKATKGLVKSSLGSGAWTTPEDEEQRQQEKLQRMIDDVEKMKKRVKPKITIEELPDQHNRKYNL